MTAAGRDVPQSLVDQLKPIGRLVMPVGREGFQELVLATKNAAATMAMREILPIAFVPLI